MKTAIDDPFAQIEGRPGAPAAAHIDYHRRLGAEARIFGDNSIGMDDPGMIPFGRILDGLAGA